MKHVKGARQRLCSVFSLVSSDLPLVWRPCNVGMLVCVRALSISVVFLYSFLLGWIIFTVFFNVFVDMLYCNVQYTTFNDPRRLYFVRNLNGTFSLSNLPLFYLAGYSHDNMNQSYRPTVRVGSVFGSGQSELRPRNGLVSTSYGNQCGIVKCGSDQQSPVQLPPPTLKQPGLRGYNQPDQYHCYSPLKRLQDLNTAVSRHNLERNLHARNHLHCASPISDDDEFEAPSVQLPLSPANDDADPFETLQDMNRNGFSPHSPESVERCSPIPNGYLHFGSTLFDSSDVKEEEDEGETNSSEGLMSFHHSPKLSQAQTVTDSKSTCTSGVDKITYKPTVFNLMSKTISELNPTLSPSALPEITMKDEWSLGEESDGDGEHLSPVDPGLISPVGTNSNVSLKHLG